MKVSVALKLKSAKLDKICIQHPFHFDRKAVFCYSSVFQPGVGNTLWVANHFWRGREKIFYAHTCTTFAFFRVSNEGCLVIVGCCNGSLYKKRLKTTVLQQRLLKEEKINAQADSYCLTSNILVVFNDITIISMRDEKKYW